MLNQWWNQMVMIVKKMDLVELKTIRKNNNFVAFKKAKHFETANNAYLQTDAKKPEDILSTNCFIIYLDITKLYPDHKEHIDGLDWTKIYVSIQPKPVLTASTTRALTTSTDIDRLVAAMDQQYRMLMI